MSLTKRSGKGSALTYNEMDDNFTHLGGDGTYQFPSTDGSADQVLSTNGSGQLSFVDQSGGAAAIAHTVNDSNLTGAQFKALSGQRIIKIAANARTYALFQPSAGDVTKSWTIINASAGDITLDADSQYVHVMDSLTIAAKQTDWRILKGGIIDVVCIGSGANGGASNSPNFVIYGAGIVDI
tara:strand:+ start:347 stop:892 length:546 start_codon:yes stop_codon:yes gene_type:complete